MREIAILMIAAFSVAGVTFVVTKPAPINLSRIPQSALTQPTKQQEGSRRAAKRGDSSYRRVEAAEPDDIKITWEIVSSTIVEQAETPEPQSAPDRIEPGMLAADVIRIYGAPELSTKQLHERKFVEHYIYTNIDKTATTQAVLENGRTVYAHTR